MIADAHNDLLLELDFRRQEERPFERYWLDNLTRGGVRLQVCPTYADYVRLPEGALRQVLGQIAAFNRAVRECDAVFAVRARGDLELSGERIGLMLSMEGCEAFGYDPSAIDLFWELGVRMVSLTWNRRNPFADGVADRGGLSRLGEQLVDRMAALGVAVDLAHASPQTFAEVLERAPGATVLVSHAGCRALREHPRNLHDEQLRALAERGGLLGIMMLPLVVHEDDFSIERVLDHVDHAVEVMGIEHVCFGGDFVRQVEAAVGGAPAPDLLLPPGLALGSTIEGLAGPEDYPALLDALRSRGYEGERLEALASGNLLRVLRETLPTE